MKVALERTGAGDKGIISFKGYDGAAQYLK